MINTNVLGLMDMTHAALPHLLERPGAVVQMSSAASRVTRPAAVYNASKFAVGAFSDVLRQEVAERGVRVVVVEPGAVDTPLREHITDAAARATLPEHVACNEILIRPTRQSW